MLFSKVQPVRVVVLNFPQTTTILALSLMAGTLMFTPMVATIGESVPDFFKEEVIKISEAVRSALLLVIGFYFAKVVNAGQESMVNKTLDIAAASSPNQQENLERPNDDYK